MYGRKINRCNRLRRIKPEVQAKALAKRMNMAGFRVIDAATAVDIQQPGAPHIVRILYWSPAGEPMSFAYVAENIIHFHEFIPSIMNDLFNTHSAEIIRLTGDITNE